MGLVNHKMTYTKAKEIRDMHLTGNYTQIELSRSTGFSKSIINDVILKKRFFGAQHPNGNCNSYGRYYLIYDDGKIWNDNQGKFLKHYVDKNGYSAVVLHGNRKSVHRLILENFDRLPLLDEVCRHLDGNSQNNNISNLKWGTPSENEKDKVQHNTDLRGEKAPATNTTDQQVLQIRKDFKKSNLNEFQFSKQKCALYNISSHSLYKILKYKTWSHI